MSPEDSSAAEIFTAEICAAGARNPWKTLSSRTAYENPWITVREDQVIRPDGKPGIYGVVETRIATGIVALTPDREVYLVGQYRYAMKQYSWEIIEGGGEGNELPIDTIRRELREEAGLSAQMICQLGSELHLSNCHSSEIALVYIGLGLTSGDSAPEGTEELEIRKIPFQRALDMIRLGAIKDVMSIIGLQRAEQFLRQRDGVR